MERSFSNQNIVFSNNAAMQAESNWKVMPTQPQQQSVAMGKPAFDNQWIAGNQLSNDTGETVEVFVMGDASELGQPADGQPNRPGGGVFQEPAGNARSSDRVVTPPVPQRPAISALPDNRQVPEQVAIPLPALVPMSPVPPQQPPPPSQRPASGFQPGSGAAAFSAEHGGAIVRFDPVEARGRADAGEQQRQQQPAQSRVSMTGQTTVGSEPAREQQMPSATPTPFTVLGNLEAGFREQSEATQSTGGRGSNVVAGLRAPGELQEELEDSEFQKREAAVIISPLATRFASLDIDIPVDGQEFVFTSPRGEVELSARCYAKSDVTRCWYLLLSLFIVAVVFGIERYARRWQGRK